MKNQNEENQILSHDEEAHLNFNNHSHHMQYENSPININNIEGNSQNNMAVNLNINQLKQNNNMNPAINQNMNHQRFHINANSLRIRNLDPNNQNQNYPRPYFPHQHQHQHQHQYQHQHQHDYTNPKFLLYLVLGTIRMTNYRILKIFSGFTSTLDMYISKSKISPYIKRFIHSKQIIIIISTLNIQYLFYSIQKIPFLDFLNKTTLRLFVFSVLGLNLHYWFYIDKLFVENDEEIEKFVAKRNPEIKKGKCEFCGVIRICRSTHCPFCNKCVKKFQLHSDWFNICIGGNNELVYAVTLFFANLYFFMSTIIIWYYILVRSDLLNYLILVFSIFGIIGIYFLFNSLKFLYSFIFENLLVNLTVYEKMNQRRLTYLWSGDHMNSFFNPFDKGIQRNIEEMLVNLFDVNIYSQYKNLSCNNDLSEIIDEKKEEPKDDFYVYNEFNAFKMMIKLTEHFDPFVSNKGNIYKFVDGKEIINWNRLMVFTAFDIINCPFKENMVNRAKMMLKQREMYNQNMQNMQRFNINRMKNNNDENKNKENIEVIDKDENNENNKIEIETGDGNENENNNENNDNQENKENNDNKEENENDKIDENIDNEKEKL